MSPIPKTDSSTAEDSWSSVTEGDLAKIINWAVTLRLELIGWEHPPRMLHIKYRTHSD